jgi:hypothetical protein
MNIIEEYKNPCRTRWVKRFNSLPVEIQEQINHIDDLPSITVRLKPIKRAKQPTIEEGTIFAVKTLEDVFFFGKVINAKLNLPNIRDGFFAVFFFNEGSKDIENFPTELTHENILFGPLILNDGFWKNGICYTVGCRTLTESERQLEYGFYLDRLSGFILSAEGKALNKEPVFLDFSAYTTIAGIEKELKKEFIINPKLLNIGI